MAFTCPRCAQPLTSHRTATATVEGCLACGGLFLDRDSRNRVVTAKCAETAAASDLAAAHARWTPDLHARASCPVCGQPMQATRVAGNVELDVCEQHGAWFDRNELRQFIDALTAQRPKRESKGKRVAKTAAVGAATGAVAVAVAATSTSGSGLDAEDAADIAEAGFSVLEIFGELLGALAD